MRGLITFFLLAVGLNGTGFTLLRQDIQLTQPLSIYGGVLVVGGFNGDGRLDVVVATASGLAVILNLGHASFGPAISTGISQPAPVAIADFNKDGKLDLAAYGQIAFGRGDGTFLPPRPTSPTWFVAAAANFNGDALPDLAVIQAEVCENGDPACSVLLVLLGNGDGTFRSGYRAQVAGAPKPIVADFDRDGKADIAVDSGYAVTIFLGNGDGSFKALSAIPVSAGPLTTGVLAADVNGDGIPDLVSRSDVFLGCGDGGFQPPLPFNSSAGTNTPAFENPFALADLDGDGHVDPATVESSLDQPVTNRMRIFLGRGDGTFSSPVERAVGWGQAGVTADFDGDGLSDLLVLNWRSNSLSLLLTKTGPQAELRAVSAAEGTGVVAPGSLATVYLPLCVPAQSAPSSLWPTTLGGVMVRIDDGQSTRRAPLLSVSEGQIKFQVPPETAPSGLADASIVVIRDGVVVQTGSMHVASVARTLFMADPSWGLPAAINTLVDAWGRTSSPVFNCTPAGCNFQPVPPSALGSYVSFYGTGFRGATTTNVQCWISGRPLTVTYAGAQGTPGLDQIDILLPGPDDEFCDPPYVEVHLSINGTQANTACAYSCEVLLNHASKGEKKYETSERLWAWQVRKRGITCSDTKAA
jgi:uncharacterized protein (TIGR03437 family)